MILSHIFTAIITFSLLAAFRFGTGAEVSAAAMEGAKSGVEISMAMAGAICLWTGLAHVMEKSGITQLLAKFFRPLLGRIFPTAAADPQTFGSVCGNFTANLLGLGNAATPMGIAAVQRMKASAGQDFATDEMCRLIVLNTASIQLIPTTAAAVRAGLGAAHAFDILPAVWVCSLLSASSGVLAAWLMGKRRG